MKLALVSLLCCLAAYPLFAGETNLILTVDGVIYSNVTFGTATPISVAIRHSTGIATIPLQKLPPDIQQRFGYDPKNAAEYGARVESEPHRKVSAMRCSIITRSRSTNIAEERGGVRHRSLVGQSRTIALRCRPNQCHRLLLSRCRYRSEMAVQARGCQGRTEANPYDR